MNLKTLAYVPLGIVTAFSAAGCNHYVTPEPTKIEKIADFKQQGSLQDNVASKLVEIVKGKCDRSYVDEKVVVCDKEISNGQYRQEFGINLETICDVHIIERHFPWLIEYLWGDKLCIDNTKKETYCLTMSDKVVAEAGSLLQYYIKAEGKKCNYEKKNSGGK